MVWFQCEDCGEELKKPKLPNHFRMCSATKLSCLDCGETFGKDSVQGHNQCMTEAEKYGPKGQSKPSNVTHAKPKNNSKQHPDFDINKTKPTQHSIRDLRGLGLTPNIIACRSTKVLDENVKAKLSRFCYVPNPRKEVNAMLKKEAGYFGIDFVGTLRWFVCWGNGHVGANKALVFHGSYLQEVEVVCYEDHDPDQVTCSVFEASVTCQTLLESPSMALAWNLSKHDSAFVEFEGGKVFGYESRPDIMEARISDDSVCFPLTCPWVIVMIVYVFQLFSCLLIMIPNM